MNAPEKKRLLRYPRVLIKNKVTVTKFKIFFLELFNKIKYIVFKVLFHITHF